MHTVSCLLQEGASSVGVVRAQRDQPNVTPPSRTAHMINPDKPETEMQRKERETDEGSGCILIKKSYNQSIKRHILYSRSQETGEGRCAAHLPHQVWSGCFRECHASMLVDIRVVQGTEL